MSNKILLVGGGGHCKSVIDTLVAMNKFSEIGIVEKTDNYGQNILGIPILGCDEDLPALLSEGYKYAFITVGSVGDPKLRIKLFEKISEIGFKIPNIIDPSAIVSKNSELENGIFVGKRAVINAGARVKRGAIINTGAIIEHDCIIEDFVHIAPGAVLSGEVKVELNTHIGAGSIVKQQIKIGSNSIVGMGSIVLRDIEDNIVVYGNPCKEAIT